MGDTLLVIASSIAEHIDPPGQIEQIVRQFGINWKILLAQIVNFCLVVFILWKFAFKPVVRTIDQRQKEIADGLQYAEEMKRKLVETEQQQAKTLKETQLETQKILNQARNTAKTIIEKKTQEATTKAQETIKKTEQSLQQERVKMFADMRHELSAVVIQTTAKVLQKELSEQEKITLSQRASEELLTLSVEK
jgi:F-type H+-transporting ATPase subunit b